ncbi:hypothetical protein [Staphylococcus warneri]|nr:hypothetical protein [Staphylococcus warneri]
MEDELSEYWKGEVDEIEDVAVGMIINEKGLGGNWGCRVGRI